MKPQDTAASAATASTTAPVARSDDLEKVTVTLEHSSFGSYSFAAEESKVSSMISSSIARARKEADVRAKVKDIDSQQNAVASDMGRARARIEAAELLSHTEAKAKEQAGLDALVDKSNALSAERGKVLATLD